MKRVDQAWADAVIAACDPVFEAADVGFTFNGIGIYGDTGPVATLLWEADPLRFVERYPERWVEESYGDQWPAPCLDWWIYLEGDQARLSVEGGVENEAIVPLSGSGPDDGAALAFTIARLLGVRSDPSGGS